MNQKLYKLAKMILKFAETKVGDMTWVHEGADLVVGLEVMTEDADGNMVPVADGEYMYEGNKIKVEDGKITEIEAETIEEAKPADTTAETEEAMKKGCQLEEQTEEANNTDADKDLRIAELEGLLKDRDAIIEELTAKIKELEDKIVTPKEEPIQMNKVTIAKADKSINPALKYFED